MSFLRYDVTTNDWVIFAPERTRRPHDLKTKDRLGVPSASAASLCPFCPGNEHLAGPEIYALRGGTAPNTPGWTVRVVPNKFPALRIEEDHRRHEEGTLFRFMGGCGAHEVIIETPEHDCFLADHPVEHIEFVLRTLQLRFNDLMRDTRFQAIVIFKNHGEGAGTSLRHPHWQLIATPVVPRALRLKHAVATDYFDQSGNCLYCDLLEEELAVRERIVVENEHYAAIMPYASHVPFETWILPKVHRSSFGWVEPARLQPLAALLKAVLGKLYQALNNPDYNLTINTAPRGDEDKRYLLWHLEILPRLGKPAGFELGSGMSINPVLPEEAASFLREVKAP
jgi:UDPglucose--hexose-1-phosphate uridylyltransferase